MTMGYTQFMPTVRAVLILIFATILSGCAPQPPKPVGYVRFIQVEPEVEHVQIMVLQPREFADKAKLITSPDALCNAFVDFGRADMIDAICADERCDNMLLTYICRERMGF